MLTCIPQSLCSWDYQILGSSVGPAAVTSNFFFTEQGIISLGAIEYTIRKHGILSGHWTLERNGQIAADARKPSAMFRSFEMDVAGLHLTVKAQSAFTRSYEIVSAERIVGTIRPAHSFTRRAFIECAPEIPEVAQLFAFWLVVVTWKRAANNNSSST